MTTKLAVLGNPIEHSLSPIIHSHFAKLTLQDLTYDKILVQKDFATSAQEFFAQKGLGCNVTVPCKKEAFDFVHKLTARAQAAQAVNTIKSVKQADGSIILLGDNTDGLGLLEDLVRLQCPLANSNILILGAGGATCGILLPLLSYQNEQQTKVNKITIANRTLSKAIDLVKSFEDQRLSCISYEELQNTKVSKINSYQVIINATSASMHKELIPIPDALYQKALFAYDLFYTPHGSTVFTNKALACGTQVAFDGLGMLVGQAALSFELWFGVKPDVSSTLDYLRLLLKERTKV